MICGVVGFVAEKAKEWPVGLILFDPRERKAIGFPADDLPYARIIVCWAALHNSLHETPTSSIMHIYCRTVARAQRGYVPAIGIFCFV